MKRYLSRPKSRREGYALVMVLLAIALLFSIYSVSYRNIAMVLRAEKARVSTQRRDEGSLIAVARGLDLLETGLPPTNTYKCATVVSTSSGDRSFTVTFSSIAANEWSVHAAPTPASESPAAMPPSFGP